MPSSCAPVGSALPPRRDQAVTAADTTPAPSRSDWGDSINVPRARDRMLDFFEREQLPGDVKSTLAAALNGDLHYQHLLFVAMIDSWPKLQANIGEIARLASIAPWKVIPFALRGQDPTPKAEKLAKDVEEIIWRMKPDVKRGEHDLEGLIASFATAYYMGHGVEETRWIQAKDGSWKIKGTKPLPARYYGYPYDSTTPDDEEDRLMLDPEGSMGARNFVDFPDHRFLIAINKGHPGHPATAAPLRALAAYWLAAVYGLKWFMNFTQLYGIPWRHAEVADAKDDNAVGTMLAEIGSRGYVITRPGTKINILESSKGGNQLPQEELIDLADKQCDVFILGQTLTSGTDGSGSRALGEIHKETKDGRVDAVTDFVGRILTHQLLPAIVAVNWGGDREDIPEMWAKREEVRDEKALAERDEKLGITDGSTPVTKSWFYERHGLPIPADGEELLFQPAPDVAQGDPATGELLTPFETKGGLESDSKGDAPGKPVKAAYNPSQPRNPKGDEGGGRWTDGGGDGSSGDVSGSDAKYLELAKDPEGNREALRVMVENAAEKAGYDTNDGDAFWHGSPPETRSVSTTGKEHLTKDQLEEYKQKSEALDQERRAIYSEIAPKIEEHNKAWIEARKQGLDSPEFEKRSHELYRPLTEHGKKSDALDKQYGIKKPETIFEKIKRPLDGGFLDPSRSNDVGVHFSGYKRTAEIFAKDEGSLYGVYLDKRSSARVDDVFSKYRSLGDATDTFHSEGMISDSAYGKISKLAAKADSLKVDERDWGGRKEVTQTWDALRKAIKTDKVLVYQNEFEGGGDSYAVFNAAQIKSADPITYDADGNVIPLSKRFDPTKKSISAAYSSDQPRVDKGDTGGGQSEPETVDRLADSVLEDLTGVTREWLTPVRPAFERLAALAMSKNVTDADFLAALEKAQRDMPELFDKLNSEALETAFENAIGSAMLAGSVKRYEP